LLGLRFWTFPQVSEVGRNGLLIRVLRVQVYPPGAERKPRTAGSGGSHQ
jgi:hypothetical protein